MKFNMYLSPTATNTGYGYIQWKITKALMELGHDIEPLNPGVYFINDFDDVYEGDRQYELFLNPTNASVINAHDKILSINYPTMVGKLAGQKSYVYTMWESDNLPKYLVNCLNKHDVIIVPCKHNAEHFAKCGVTRPIFHVPLANDQKDYHYLNRNWDISEENPFTFLHMGFPNWRKGGDLAMKAFKKVFPTQKDVQLIMKCSRQYCNPKLMAAMKSSDERIYLMKDHLKIEDMRDLYQVSHCQLGTSRGDGWNLFIFDGLATGLTSIINTYCGTNEFAHLGMPLRHIMTDSQHVQERDKKNMEIFDEPWGWFGEPDFDHLCELMEFAYKNPSVCREQGQAAARTISDNYSWNKTAQMITKIMED